MMQLSWCETMDRLTYLFKQYDTILGWYKQAEAKSTILHAINGLLVGVLNGLVFVGVDKVSGLRHFYGGLIWILLTLTAFCVVGSYLFMLKAVWARHHGKEPPLSNSEKLWFFGHIAELSRETYKQQLDPFDPAKIEATMLAQNQILAHNVVTKFDALNSAISLTIVAIILFFGLGLAYASAILVG